MPSINQGLQIEINKKCSEKSNKIQKKHEMNNSNIVFTNFRFMDVGCSSTYVFKPQ